MVLPKSVQELHGSYKGVPQSGPAMAPGYPDPPRRFHNDPSAMAIWDDTIQALDSVGLLSSSDRSLVEVLVDCWQLYIEAHLLIKAEGPVVDGKQHPLTVPRRYHLDQAIKVLTQLGLSPAARSRITATVIEKSLPEDASEFLS